MNENQAVNTVVSQYLDAVVQNDLSKARAALSNQLMMVNGNYSSDPKNFQAHLFLHDDQIDEWLSFFLNEAGPHQNQFEIVHTHIRANAAVVVTQETGQNKFRVWENELVTYLLGLINEEWKIVGLFIRDQANPES